MNLGTYDATIDFSKLFVHNSTSIYFKEGDLNTARVRAKLTMQGKSIDITGCNILVKIETMTGQKINDVATIIDATNGIVEIDFKSNSLVEGTNFFELKIVKGESVKESPKLAYRVLDSIEDAGSIEATNEYPILISLISDANKAIEDANEALALANTMKTNLEEVIDNANSAIGNATDATNNANTAATNATSKITEVDNAKNDMTTKVDESIDTMKLEVNSAKNDMKITVDEAIKFLKQEFNSLTAQQQEELEMLQARDGEVNLNARLERDLYIGEKSLKQEVLDLAGLKEVQEVSYSTDKGFLVCKETKAGTVKDLKLCGKSLLNKIGKFNTLKWVNNSLGTVLYYGVKVSSFNLEIGKEYTIKVFGFGDNVRDDRIIISSVNESKLIQGSNYTFKFTLNTFDDATDGFIHFYNKDGKTIVQSDYENAKILLLEGDHTQNPPSYFEGIASVGTGVDKIEVSSVKSDGNLVGSLQFDEEESVRITANELFTVSLESKDSTGSNVPQVVFLDSNKNIIDFFNITQKENDRYFRQFTLNKEIFFIKIKSSTSAKINIDKICVNLGTNKTYIEAKQDKKTLLYKDSDGTWKPVTELRSCPECFDSVEFHSDGKYYYHIRTEKKSYSPNDESNSNVITDKTNTIAKLAKEKVFEVNPLFLEAFDGETMILINSGVINALMEFKITSYITNLVLLNQKRIKELENELYKTNLANFTVALNTLDTKLKLEQLTKSPR